MNKVVLPVRLAPTPCQHAIVCQAERPSSLTSPEEPVISTSYTTYHDKAHQDTAQILCLAESHKVSTV